MSEDRIDQVVLSRPELLGLVPYELGFHPTDSMVAVFVTASRMIKVFGRLDLAAPPAVVVQEWAQIAQRHDIASVILIGYGPRDAAQRLSAAADALAARVAVIDVLLVSKGWYYCLRCACPESSGVPFDPSATATAARSAVDGRVALPSRDEFLALTAPNRAEQAAVSAALVRLPAEDDSGPAVVRYLMEQAADGQWFSVEQVARLARLLRELPLRDLAWRATDTAMWQRDLWLEMTRRVPDSHVAAPASLAAWCAWQRGEETLAVAAVQRARVAEPGYMLARLIEHAVRHHVPARELRGRLNPPQSAASAGEQS